MTIAIANVWALILKGGALMWPIFLFSVMAITLGIEKFLYLSSLRNSIQKIKPLFFKAMVENRMKEALGVCEANPDGLGAICKAGLMKFGSSPDIIRASMVEAAGWEIHRMKQRVSLLAFIPNLVILLGLLGTTSALCVVFRAVQMRSNALVPMSLGDMSSGVWQALITTCAGLVVGIITYTIYSFIAVYINDVVLDFEQTINEAVELLQGVVSHES